jgi:SAM-dependent methyltransferase
MLTVDFERLDLRDRETLLDLGCGGGRHAFEAMRRGATVVALDADAAELKDAAAVSGGMVAARELPHGPAGGMVNGDALRLPFPDESFDRIIAAEVLEHIPDDEATLRELVRAAARRPDGGHRTDSLAGTDLRWALDHQHHDTPGGTSHYRQLRAGGEARAGGIGPAAGSPRTCPPLSVLDAHAR